MLLTRYIVKMSIVIVIMLPFYLLLRGPWRRIPEKYNPAPAEEEFSTAKNTVITGKIAMTKKTVAAREIAMGCFVLFTAGLLALALEGEYQTLEGMFAKAAQRLTSGEGVNIVPFRTIVSFFRHFSMDIFMVNIVGNVVMFMPWGFGLVLLWKRNQNAWTISLYSLFFTLLIEVSQLFIGRSVDVDDLILNYIGSCLGAGLYFLLRRKFPGIAELAW